MVDKRFPTNLQDAANWAERYAESISQAEDRFILYAALDSIARWPRFRGSIVLRGAAALWLFYGNPRPANDIDLIDLTLPVHPTADLRKAAEDEVKTALSEGLPNHFPDFERWRPRIAQRLRVHLSPCRAMLQRIDVILSTQNKASIQVADLHFLISEKLAGILSHHWPHEKRRSHDVADVAAMIHLHGLNLQVNLVADMLNRRRAAEPRLASVAFDDRLKCLMREIQPANATKASFQEDWERMINWLGLCR